MRKIISKYKEEKKKKRRQLIVGGVLIFVMFLSILGYAFGGKETEDTSSKVEYNGFEFVEENGFWFTSKGNLNLAFSYNPRQIEEIDTELKNLNNYYGKTLYIFSENDEATSEIYINLNQIVNRMQAACLDGYESECDENLATKTCEDNFIRITESNFTNIVQNEGCVFIQGPEENLTKITDEFLFNILDIRE